MKAIRYIRNIRRNHYRIPVGARNSAFSQCTNSGRSSSSREVPFVDVKKMREFPTLESPQHRLAGVSLLGCVAACQHRSAL